MNKSGILNQTVTLTNVFTWVKENWLMKLLLLLNTLTF